LRSLVQPSGHFYVYLTKLKYLKEQ